MHIKAKITLFMGALIALTSIFGMLIAGNSLNMAGPESEDWAGELILKEQAPMTFGYNFEWSSIYNVFVENGKEVYLEVEGLTNDDGAYFESCEIYNDCDYYDKDGYIEGFQYIGVITVVDSGYYEISFTVVDGEDQDAESFVMIREESFGGAFGVLGGFVGCCVAFIVLSLGIILSFIKKEKGELRPKQVIIVGREEPKVVPELANTDEETKLEWWKDDS